MPEGRRPLEEREHNIAGRSPKEKTMKYAHNKPALTILVALSFPGLALAWGKDGHETVGYRRS
jgi:hypothetical protein